MFVTVERLAKAEARRLTREFGSCKNTPSSALRDAAAGVVAQLTHAQRMRICILYPDFTTNNQHTDINPDVTAIDFIVDNIETWVYDLIHARVP